MAYAYRQEKRVLPEITLTYTVQYNGTTLIQGHIPTELRSNIYIAMKNSRYDFTLDKTGYFQMFIKRTSGKNNEEIHAILSECAKRLGNRSDVHIILKVK